MVNPFSISQEALEMIRSSELWDHVSESLIRVVSGYAIGSALGVVFAAMSYSAGGLGRVADGVVELLRPIPPIAWIPIAIIWQGLGNESAIVVVSIGAFFPVYVATYSALRAIPNELKAVGSSLGARGWRLFIYVEFPRALPGVLTGLQIGLGMAWMTVVAAELIGAQSGLGYIVQSSRMVLDFDRIAIGMILIGLLGFGMAAGLRALARYFVPWAAHRSEIS